jgi:hypothetical protein
MIMPKMHSNHEEWIKAGIEDICIIRVFDLQSARDQLASSQAGNVILT